jgi:hypothetical protein
MTQTEFWLLTSIIVMLIFVVGFFGAKTVNKVDNVHNFVIQQEVQNTDVTKELEDHKGRIIKLEKFKTDVQKYHYAQHGESI